jgi:RHS repeat-associated protein
MEQFYRYQFTYDKLDRLTKTVTNYAFLTTKTFTMSYGYDAASNRNSLSDPEGGAFSYAYDTLNRLTSLTPPAAFGSGSFGFGYDALSRRTSLSRPNSVNTAYSYDNLSRLLSVTHSHGSTTLDGASYTVDAVGNRLTRVKLPGTTALTYGYDAIYELLTAKQGSSTKETYSYDPVGNRLSALSGSGWSYNSANELNSRPGVSYTYDNNGNSLTEVTSAGTTSFTWDFENHLTSVKLPGSGGTVNFKYDPMGRRIEKSSSAATSIYAYDGDNLLEEVNATGGVVARYTPGASIDEPLAMLRGTTTDYYEADGLGSITSLTNASAAVAASYTYDSFGNLTTSTGTLTNPFRYTGREFDAETSLYFYRARYYDPNLGRFISEDPGGFTGGVDFYKYVVNRPTSLTDPAGLDPNGQGSWWDKSRQRWHDFWTPKQFGYAPTLYNLCESGQQLLFNEGSPVNPYYGADTERHTNPQTDAAVTAWREAFNHKCEAAQQPGKSTVVYCGQSVLGPNGPVLTCSCCEFCDNKHKGK